MVKKILLTKEEHICLSSITTSLFGLFIIIILVGALMINPWFFLGCLIMFLLFNLIGLFVNYLKWKDLMEERKKNERKTNKRKNKR